MMRLAAARAQYEERVLAEERVARDALAALDALEQERVVGVFGDLEECRDRRQQVGDDLLHDRHERAAARQLHEFFESRLLHDSSGAGWPAGASLLLPRRTDRPAAAGRSTARTAARPARRASPARRWSGSPLRGPRRAVGVSAGVVDEVEDQLAVELRSLDRVLSLRAGARGRGVDQHVPASRRRRECADLAADEVGDGARGLGAVARRSSRLPLRRRARWRPRARRRPRRASRRASPSRECGRPAAPESHRRRYSLPIHRPSRTTIVLMAPTRRARRSDLVDMRHQMRP